MYYGCQRLESCSLSSGCLAYCPELLPLSRHLPPLPLASYRCCSGWLEGCLLVWPVWPILPRDACAANRSDIVLGALQSKLYWGHVDCSFDCPFAVAKYRGTRADRSRGMRLVCFVALAACAASSAASPLYVDRCTCEDGLLPTVRLRRLAVKHCTSDK